MDEQKAIAQLKQGQIEGLELLVHKYQQQAIRAAHLITRDLYLAEDIVQSAFVRSFERIHQFEKGAAFGPWFLKIVVNDALKAATRHREVSSLSQDHPHWEEEASSLVELLPDQAPSPQQLLEQGETRQELWEALGQLSPNQRAAVVLYYYLELNHQQIAEALACPPGTVKSRLHHARQHLRKLLAGLGLMS